MLPGCILGLTVTVDITGMLPLMNYIGLPCSFAGYRRKPVYEGLFWEVSARSADSADLVLSMFRYVLTRQP